MTYKGKVKNGVVVLEDGAAFPEGTEVRIEPTCASESLPTRAEQFTDAAGTAEGLPEDMIRIHDHYPHGKTKKQEHGRSSGHARTCRSNCEVNKQKTGHQ